MVSRTGIGAGIGIPFRNIASGGGKPYLSPELKDALVGVWSAYGKSNDSTDRNIIKNKIKDRGGDFVISNAAFKLNSGFGKYEITFQYFPYRENVTNVSDSKVVFGIGGQLLIPYPAITENIPSFKIKVSGLSRTYHFRYYYRSSDGVQHSIDMAQDGYYELPICYNVQSSSDGTNCGFANNGNDVVTITQIPSFEGAFVTDGVDDLITSTKTTQEMLGGSNEITVVSMINTITPYRLQLSYTNAFPINRTNKAPLRNEVSNTGKTGIYGYTYKNNVVSVINNVLGDKNDYTAGITGEPQVDDRFEVTRTKFNSSVAWYWTFIAKKALTTDQINQVIAYFNLDRTLKPDILCDVKKQGITNENHAEFGDKLIDYSGNGRDIQLNNIAWKGDSGIGKYKTDFTKWLLDQVVDITRKYSSFNIKTKNDSRVNSWVLRAQDTVIPSMKVKVTGISSSVESLIYRYSVIDDKDYYIDITSDGIYELPQTNGKGWEGFRIIGKNFNISVEQIPSHAGALCLDGVNDFGKVTGLPIYKDYTVIADYERTDIGNIEGVGTSPVLSKSYTAGQGSFIMNFIASTGNSIRSYSFGTENTSNFNDLARQIFYQSKYKNQGFDITAGTGVDGDSLWLGTARDNDSHFFNGAIYSLMSFPYSMSEFLIERQLKKHKLGTLYPNMVEFRPVIKSNASYDNIVFYYKNEKVENGTYLTVGSSIGMHIHLSSSPVNEIKSITVNGIPATFKFHDANNNIYQYDFNLTSKSPQKINITID